MWSFRRQYVGFRSRHQLHIVLGGGIVLLFSSYWPSIRSHCVGQAPTDDFKSVTLTEVTRSW